MTTVRAPATKRGQVPAADALRVFISSRMTELAPERTAVRAALAAAGFAPWLYEVDAGASPGPPRQTYLDALYASDVYLGIFWKTRGAYTIDEFDAARRNGIACLIYEKFPAQREPELSAFLNQVGDVETGVTICRFGSSEELVEMVSADVRRVQTELVRVRSTDGRTYTGNPNGGRFDLTAKATPIRRHPLQASDGPRPPEPFVDRNDAGDRIRRAIASGESLLGVSGVPGIGKTSVLRRVAHDPNASTERFPDGIGIYIEGDEWPRAGDLLRALWSKLYRVDDQSYFPDDMTLTADLRSKSTLVFVDEVRLRADEVDRIHAEVPRSTFVLSANEAAEQDLGPLAYVKAVPLTAFEDPADIVALFGARYGQEVPSELIDGVVGLCRRAGAGPGMITRLAHEAWGSGQTLADWLARKQAGADEHDSDLNDDDRRVLGILAAFGPDVTTPWEVSSRLGVSSQQMTRLVMSGHALAVGPDQSLPGAEYQTVSRQVDLEALRGEIFDAAIEWIDEADPTRLEGSRPFLLRVLAWASEQERHRGVLPLAMAIAPHLAMSGAWDSWGWATDQAVSSARALGNRVAEGWALHEAGTRQLMLGNRREARRLLRPARRGRRRDGDLAGAAISTHNLRHAGGFAMAWRRWAIVAGVVLVIGALTQIIDAGEELDFGEVVSGNVSLQYRMFDNDGEVATTHRVEIGGDPAFCVVSPDGPICSPSAQPRVETAPVSGAPEVPECLVEQVAPADGAVQIRVEPQSECAVGVRFAPVLDPGERRREARGELRITTDEGEEVVELRGVGIRPAEVTTTTTTLVTTTSGGTSSTTTIQDNRPPVAADDSEIVLEASSVLIAVLSNDTDPDSEDLAVEVVRFPENGEATVEPDGRITYTHNGSETPEDSFTYVISDGQLSSDEATVTIEVSPVNDPPLAADDTVDVNEGGQVRIGVLENDIEPEGDLLTIVDTSTPANGSVQIVEDRVLYSHDGSETPVDSFDYTVEDGNGGAASATVTIEVIQVNDAPVARAADAGQIDCNTTVTISLGGSDDDEDGLQFTITDPPDLGDVGDVQQASDTEATVTYTSGTTEGEDAFLFQVDDGQAADSAQVSITIDGPCVT